MGLSNTLHFQGVKPARCACSQTTQPRTKPHMPSTGKETRRQGTCHPHCDMTKMVNNNRTSGVTTQCSH
jgi:hypothetical protein